MSQTSRQSQTGRLKHLYWRAPESPGGAVYLPHLYLEARVDFADVRSGLHETCNVSRVMQIPNLDPADAWTEDMLVHVDPADIQSVPPSNVTLGKSPDWFSADSVPAVETQFLALLLRSFRVKIYRNFDVNVYSRLNESLEDFKSRCIEMLNDSFRGELDRLREQFDRLLEQARERHLTTHEWAAFDSSRVIAQQRGEFRTAAERITSLFMDTELNLVPQEFSRGFANCSRTELQQSLASVELDAQYAIAKLMAAYQQKVSNIDEYIIHPNLRDIHLVRSCLLWMPGETP
jgi:hypothetical protein